ncbi:hypothetical protein L596_021780 [Steinernema carpocapsae]|uniref:Uncharacterized protein n=1 Tax=Steinernema carpocapsae TaxID=34508 RepID=A0A4U5MJR3_STECR|nr:hypothetical protein L596_021780 [Steinernema carpocapsae]
MSFLDVFEEDRLTSSSSVPSTPSAELAYEGSDDENLSTVDIFSTPARKKRKITPVKNENDGLIEMLKKSSDVLDAVLANREEDECDRFGSIIADKLRRMPHQLR